MIAYSLKDTEVLLPLIEVLIAHLEGIGMEDVLQEIEARALPSQVWMERNGFPASREVALEMAERYRQESDRAYTALMSLTEGLESPDGSVGLD